MEAITLLEEKIKDSGDSSGDLQPLVEEMEVVPTVDTAV